MTTNGGQQILQAQLARLRDTIIRDPEQAHEHVRSQLAATAQADAGFRIDLRILLAETYQRQGKAYAALAASADATAATDLPLVAEQRRTIALGVAADLAVWDRQPAAVTACTTYFHAVIREPHPHERRAVLAGALRTVAVYHHDNCDEGRRLLTLLLHRNTDDLDPTTLMAKAGLAAMHDGCRPFCQPAPIPPLPPLPGGVFSPRTDTPSVDYLTSRISRHPAVHSCSITARTTGR